MKKTITQHHTSDCKTRNETETKRNQTKQAETKLDASETKRSRYKWKRNNFYLVKLQVLNAKNSVFLD